jgi:hypothetical protein
VLDTLVDSQGQKIQIGREMDVNEFLNNLLDRLEEGLQE